MTVCPSIAIYSTPTLADSRLTLCFTYRKDHVARRAFVAASAGATGVDIETRLAEILLANNGNGLRAGGHHGDEGTADGFGNSVGDETTNGGTPNDRAEDDDDDSFDEFDHHHEDRETRSGHGSPDCRLNATLVAANLAGDVFGRRRLLQFGGQKLLDALSCTLLSNDPEKQMLAAYALGELARPLPGVVERWVSLDAACVAERGLEDRDAEIDSGENKTTREGSNQGTTNANNSPNRLPASFTKHLPMLATPDFDPLAEAGGDPLGLFAHTRNALFESMKSVARNARLGAEGVLLSGETNVERWIALGDEGGDGDMLFSQDVINLESVRTTQPSKFDFARDFAASQKLRNLPLNVKRRWLLEMLRWELGPVSPGMNFQGLMGVSLTVDR